MASSKHLPILKRELVLPVAQAALALNKQSEWRRPSVIDATLGGGGHTRELLRELAGSQIQVLAFDQDLQAVERARLELDSEVKAGRLEIVHAPFSSLERGGWLVDRSGLGLIADLGFSSDQMDDPSRGFSFNSDGPLDMRMDTSRGAPLSEALKQLNERELAQVLFEWGEERHSRRIARQLIEARRAHQLPSTPRALADLIARCLPRSAADQRRIHPATRTFQALRIYVNHEFEELDALLNAILGIKEGGVVGILTFHSLEDRRVKQRFQPRVQMDWEKLHKKPLVASDQELNANPRARSAKLRLARRLPGVPKP